MKRLGQAGDTIVEVLIALTVVASMLGGAYVTSNRSLNNNRQAQERGEALKLAEGQLERLKGLVSIGSTTPFTTEGNFCIDNNGSLQAATPQVCSVTTPGPVYYVTVERTAGNHFAVSVNWDRVGGNGSDSIKMNYRLHQVSTTYAAAEPTPLPDLCPNLSGIQATVPAGLIVDAVGNCVDPDICPNIAGVQTSVPSGMIRDSSGNCINPDICPNIAGVQTSVPSGMIRDGSGNCVAVNIAQSKSAIDDSGCTSSTYSSGSPNSTLDGNIGTAWYTGAYCFRVRVDLGQAYNLATIKSHWMWYGHDYGWGYYIDQYTIEVSSNGSNWSTISSGNSRLNTDTTTVNGNFNNVRYIRVYGRSSQNWIGIYEIEAFQ